MYVFPVHYISRGWVMLSSNRTVRRGAIWWRLSKLTYTRVDPFRNGNRSNSDGLPGLRLPHLSLGDTKSHICGANQPPSLLERAVDPCSCLGAVRELHSPAFTGKIRLSKTVREAGNLRIIKVLFITRLLVMNLGSFLIKGLWTDLKPFKKKLTQCERSSMCGRVFPTREGSEVIKIKTKKLPTISNRVEVPIE